MIYLPGDILAKEASLKGLGSVLSLAKRLLGVCGNPAEVLGPSRSRVDGEDDGLALLPDWPNGLQRRRFGGRWFIDSQSTERFSVAQAIAMIAVFLENGFGPN